MTKSLGSVVLVGVLDVVGSTNLYMAKAFMKAGYEVIPVNYRTIINTFGDKTLDRTLYRLSLDKPTLMLFSKCNGIDSAIVGRCSLNAKTWLWFMDGLQTLNTVPEIVDHMSMADYSSCTGLGVAKEIHKRTGIEVHHIMEGIDQDVYHPSVQNEQFNADVSFIGTANQERSHYMKTLAENGFDVKAYGHGFGNGTGEVHGGMFNMVCSSSSAMLAMSVEHNTNEYFSDRIFRYGACGSFVLHKHSPGMERYFEDGKEIVYFRDEASLVKAANKYLSEDAFPIRNEIAQNLYNKILTKHTWDASIEQICKIAEIR